jgi:hypothetical protein
MLDYLYLFNPIAAVFFPAAAALSASCFNKLVQVLPLKFVFRLRNHCTKSVIPEAGLGNSITLNYGHTWWQKTLVVDFTSKIAEPSGNTVTDCN